MATLAIAAPSPEGDFGLAKRQTSSAGCVEAAGECCCTACWGSFCAKACTVETAC
jgi:hypothetical protein